MLMTLLGTAVTVLSLLLDNVTTVVIFGPLIILIARAMKVTPIPFLLAAAQNASDRFANKSALQHYQHMLDLMDRKPAEETFCILRIFARSMLRYVKRQDFG